MSHVIHDTPVALVCFNRPAHMARVLDALRRDGIRNLYVFCDGPRNDQDLPQVEAVARLIEQIDWTTPKVVRRRQNIGLARSVVSAVNTVLADHETIILLEDDCVPKPYFFAFMRDCLSRYRDHDRIFGINGYCVPIPDELRSRYPYDIFFYPRIGSWGWATWRRAWKAYDPDLAGLYRRCLAEGIDLKQGGPDIPESVQNFLGGQPRDIWTLNWVLAVYLNRGYSIYPTVSQIQNVGLDGSGVHFGRSKSKFDYIAPDQPVVRFPDQPVLADELIEHYNSFFGGTKVSRPPVVAASPAPAPQPSTPPSSREPLSIVHINTHDIAGGAAKVAWRIAHAQRQMGHNATLLVGYKKSDSPHSAAFALDTSQSLYEQAVQHGLLNYHLQGSHRLPQHPAVRSADLLHLHNLHGNYFNPFSLAALSLAKPVVWTLHDMQAITGHCASSMECMLWQQGCPQCPHLDREHALAVDASAQLLRDKQLIYDHSRLQIVVPSEWLRRHVEKSVLRDHPVELIYNGIETAVFKPYDKAAARQRFGLPHDRILIGAVAIGGSLNNPWKGGWHTRAVMDRVGSRYPQSAFVSIGGSGSTALPNVIQLPHIGDESELAMAYSALDIFLYTPLADNCPLVVLEALSCGLPIVSFATGGVGELVRSGIDGWITEFKNAAQTAAAVENLIADASARSGFAQNARRQAVERFEHSKVVDQYQRLYERVLSETQRSRRAIPSLPLDTVHPFIKTPAFLEAQSEIRTTPDSAPSRRNVHRPQSNSIDQTTSLPAESKSGLPDVSFVVATKNRGALLDAMLESLTPAARGVSLEVIAIEGGSADQTAAVLGKHGVTQVFNEFEHFGPGRHSWPQLYNFGFARARGRYAMYASDDIVFGPDSIARAVRYLDSLSSSVAGGIFFYRNLHTRPDWDKFGIDFTHGQKLLMNYGLVRRDCFQAVGGLDESYRFYCADADLCLKLYGAGKQLVPLRNGLVVHNNILDAQKQSNAQTSQADTALFFGKWKHIIPTREPEPRRLLWRDEMAELYSLPAAAQSVGAEIEPYWHALAQYQYQQFAEARDNFERAIAAGLDDDRVRQCAMQAARAAGISPSTAPARRPVMEAEAANSLNRSARELVMQGCRMDHSSGNGGDGRTAHPSQESPTSTPWQAGGSTAVASGDPRRDRPAAPRRDPIQGPSGGPRETPRMALSDNQTYPQICVQASLDFRVFNTFRRNPLYTQVLEHVTEKQGAQYLEIIAEDPDLLRRMADFRENDLYGGPQTCEYPGLGRVSPTTLRYIKVLWDLKKLFKTLDDLHLSEIGVGYGGQCRIINALFRPKTYCLVDIRPALNLAQRYLDHFILHSTAAFLTMNELQARNDDLVISNYAFTELSRPLQDIYLERIIRRSRRGYITYNEITPAEYRSYKAEELTTMIPGSRVLAEEPLTHPRNCIIAWGMDATG